MADVLNIPFTAIPEGEATCTISPLVNAILNIPEWRIITPSISETASYDAPSFVFCITHKPSGKVILYDLGIRYNWETTYEESLRELIKQGPPILVGDVGNILEDGGVNPNDVTTIVISHQHWDHTGNIEPFPNAEIVGGKGTIAADLREQVETFGRKSREIDFENDTTSPIGAFEKAYDFFGDGSVWLCTSPGHTVGHTSALIRTSAGPTPTYVLLSGDTCHHPTLINPEPHDFKLAMFEPRDGGARAHPALPPLTCMHFKPELAWDSIQRTRRMEAEDNVMVVLAHDYAYWRAWQTSGEIIWPGKRGIQAWKEEGLKLSRKYNPESYDTQ